MTIQKFLFALSILAFSGISCEKQNALTAAQPGQSPFTASYIVRGNTYTTNEFFSILNDQKISIRIIANNGNEIMLNIDGDRVGNYELFKSSRNVAVYKEITEAGNVVEYFSNLLEQSYITGAINITSINLQSKTLSGSFFFSGFASNGATVNVSNGYFTDIPYNDTLRVEQLSNVLTAFNDTVPLNFRLITGFSYGDTIIEIKAQSTFSNPQRVLTLSMPYNITPGNYPFTTAGPYIGTYRQSGSPVTVSESGQLAILFHALTSMRLVGNFAFNTKGPPVFKINTGSMIINYQKVEE